MHDDAQGSGAAAGPQLAAKGAILLAFIVAFEIVIMISPFALFFYAVFNPFLLALDHSAATRWLTALFLPHLIVPPDLFLATIRLAGSVLFVLGMSAFLLCAIQVYAGKLRKTGEATRGLYAVIRHPQYASLSAAGIGLAIMAREQAEDLAAVHEPAEATVPVHDDQPLDPMLHHQADGMPQGILGPHRDKRGRHQVSCRQGPVVARRALRRFARPLAHEHAEDPGARLGVRAGEEVAVADEPEHGPRRGCHDDTSQGVSHHAFQDLLGRGLGGQYRHLRGRRIGHRASGCRQLVLGGLAGLGESGDGAKDVGPADDADQFPVLVHHG
jgi:protein-S-isoprenylcysteine O-methyltransferase Ste14